MAERVHAPTIERGIEAEETALEFDISEIDAILAGVVEAAGQERKRRLEEHMDAARNTTGGRGYDFETIVDAGHSKSLGGVAISGASGMGARPYGMPVLRSRRQITNPYVSRSFLRY